MRKFGLVLLLVVLASKGAVTVLAQSAPPNIVIILADDLGYGDVGFNGCPDFPTPNIDSIANNGVLCTNGYVTHPFCSPSRAALLTGRYQQRFGHENQPEGDTTNPRLGLPLQELLLPQMLKPAGYLCGMVGKWHLGWTPNFYPRQRGFDEFFGFLGASSGYFNAKLFRDETPLTEPEYLTDAFTREGVSFINRHASQPFFLCLGYNAVHQPYDQPPAIYMDRVANISDPDRRNYAAMVTALDDGVGQVLQALQAQNLLDKTLIFFLSDNGAPEHTFTRNLPLRGYKKDVLEGGIRVPFAVQWTGRLPTHSVYSEPVSSLDLVATVAAAAGVSLPADRAYDGLNIVPYLAGEQVSPERTLFFRWFGLGKDGPPGSLDTIWAVRSGPLKLVTERATTGNPPALYNLPGDIGETQDLAGAQPVNVDSLKSLYAQWSSKIIPPLWQKISDWNIALPLVMAGDWNAFNKNDATQPWQLTRISAPGVEPAPDGLNSFINTVHVAAAGGDTEPGVHSFVLVAGKSYSNQWGGVTINIDSTTSIPFFSGDALGPTNSISLEDGFYYSMRIIDQRQKSTANLTLAVMKTSAPPVSVSQSGQTPALPNSQEPVVVSILTSQPKSAEERIYVRWSTDFFVTSHLVEAAGAGLSYTATIPAQSGGTAVQYSIVTSTVDLSPYLTSGIIDSLTLAASTISTFMVSGATPTPTGTPTPTPTPTPSSADLRATVTDGKTAALAGSKDTYTIVVTNAGPSSVAGAAVSDSFPAGFSGVNFTATQSGGASGFTATGTGNISDTATMPAGSFITYKATGKISSSATGTLSNAATVTAPNGVTDSNPANNSATDTDTIKFQADLKITVTDGKAAIAAGSKDTYTIVVTNSGPSDVTGARVSDSFPSSFTGVTYTATQSGGASGFTATGSGNINDTVTMPSGSKITYKAMGTISSSATGTQSDTGAVTTANGVTDPNLTNNSATDTDTLW